MKVGELIFRLSQMNRDADVMFDTEAQTYDVHMVPVDAAWPISTEEIGREVVCLHEHADHRCDDRDARIAELEAQLEELRRAFCFIDAATAVDEGKSACDYAESFYPNMDEDDCLPGMAFSHAHKYAEELYERKVWEAVIAALAEKEVGDGTVD